MRARDAAPIGLKPAAELAERVLLPGDPHRALAVAQALLTAPKMFNHHRGLWGYTGEAPDGGLLTVQSTGMGGPSAAIVVEELIAMGARRLVRIGTCGAFGGGLEIGDLIVAAGVLADDGTSRALGSPERLEPDLALTEALLATRTGAATPKPVTVVTTDLFYDERPDVVRRWIDGGAAAVEMEAATVLQVAARRDAAAGCLLGVTDLIGVGPQTAGRRRIAPEAIEALGIELGRVGLEALSALGGSEAAGPTTR